MVATNISRFTLKGFSVPNLKDADRCTRQQRKTPNMNRVNRLLNHSRDLTAWNGQGIYVQDVITYSLVI